MLMAAAWVPRFVGLWWSYLWCGWIVGFSGFSGFSGNLKPELLAIYFGIKLAWDRGFRHVMCVSDSLLLFLLPRKRLYCFINMQQLLLLSRSFCADSGVWIFFISWRTEMPVLIFLLRRVTSIYGASPGCWCEGCDLSDAVVCFLLVFPCFRLSKKKLLYSDFLNILWIPLWFLFILGS